MYVYDTRNKVFYFLKKILDQEPIIQDVKNEITELKSILKTSKNKVDTVKIIEQPSYLFFSDEKLFKIANKNVRDTQKFINKHKLKNLFLHFSLNKIEKFDSKLDSSKNKSNNLYYKPKGLWISHGSSWLDYIESNIKIANETNLFGYIYKIDIFDSIKLITNKDDLFKFIKLYKKKPNDIKIYDIMDWDRIKKDFDGLIITPWLGDKIWHLSSSENMEIIGGEIVHDFFVDLIGSKWKNNMMLLSEWYRKWNCASGVIWNTKGIASCDLIKQIDFSKYI